MKFDYHETEFVNPSGKLVKIYRPFLELYLTKRGTKTIQVLGLLDSGADIVMFPLHFADYFEIPYRKAEKFNVQVAGGEITTAYHVPFELHKIELKVAGKTVKLPIDFCNGQPYPLLGQTFFENFRVNFNRKSKTFELI